MSEEIDLRPYIQLSAHTIQTTPIDLEINNSSQMLANHFQDLQQVESWLTAARALQDQVVSDTGSTTANLGNMLALVFLRGQVFGGIGSVQLQIDLNADAVEPVQPADVDTLIDVLEARRQATQAQIDALLPRLVSTELTELTLEPDHPLNARIAGLTTDLLMFHSELEAQTMRQRELEQTRDLAWETYQVLVEKQVEEEIAARTPGTEVRLASSAVPPDQPVSAPLRSNVMVAGALGLMLSIFVVFVENWWSGEMAQPQWQPATYANSSYTSRPTVRYPPGDELKSAQPLVEDGDPGQPTSNR
ncbi:MAG TPA: GNVR domain-containing protein [Anaerolineae bacterium]